jgi:hypothetical protein
VTSLIDRQHCRNNGSHFRELQSRSLRLFDSTHPYSFRTIRVASGYGVAHRGRHLRAIYSGRCKLRFEEVQSYRPDASDRRSDLVPFGLRIESAPVHKQNSRRLFSDLRISSTSPAADANVLDVLSSPLVPLGASGFDREYISGEVRRRR